MLQIVPTKSTEPEYFYVIYYVDTPTALLRKMKVHPKQILSFKKIYGMSFILHIVPETELPYRLTEVNSGCFVARGNTRLELWQDLAKLMRTYTKKEIILEIIKYRKRCAQLPYSSLIPTLPTPTTN